MRLAAIFFYEDERLKNNTFNFGGHYHYTLNYFNDKLTIERIRNELFIDNFYGNKNINSISSIVGENGSGKSTIFKTLKNLKNNYFLIYEESEAKQYVYNTNRFDFDNFFDTNNFTLLQLIFINEVVTIENYQSQFSREIILPFKQHKINLLYYFPNSVYDLELNKIDDFVVKNHQNNLNKIKSSIFNRQIRFLSDDLIVSKIKEIYKEFPYYDSITIVSAGNFMKDYKYHDIRKFGIENKLNDYEVEEYAKRNDIELNSFFSKLNDSYDRSSRINFKIFISIYYRLLYVVINNANYSLVKVIGQLELKIDIHLNLFKDEKYDLHFIQELFEIFSTGVIFKVNGSQSLDDVINLINNFLKTVNIVTEKIDLKNKKFRELNEFINGYYQLLDFFESNIENTKSKQEVDVSFLRFDSGKNLSTGEISLLNFFSSIYHYNIINKKTLKDVDLLIFLLDEPELGFHPLWKKRFVNSVINLLPIFFEDKQIQIILSTHDPLTLSDFQISNTLFLTKMKDNCLNIEKLKIQKKTFGANITDLLADSFFVGDGLIGEFAKNKIQDIIEYINDEKIRSEKKWISSPEVAKKVIEQIGEPYLCEKLNDMFLEAFPEFQNEEIKRLEDKLKQLRNGSNPNK